MPGLSYKDMLTNMLIVFINKRIQESKDIEDKVNTLDEEKKKKFHKKVVEFVISKAKGLAEIQGTNYLGVEDDTVIKWIQDFFDEFEENMKEPEKPKTTIVPKSSSTTGISTKPGNATYKVEDGLFGLEIFLDKKTKLNKEDFINKMKEQYKGETVEFEWKQEEVIVTHKPIKKEKVEETEDEIEETEDEATNLEENEIEETEETEDEIEEEVVLEKPKKEKVVKETKPKKEKVVKEEKPKVEEPEEEDGLF